MTTNWPKDMPANCPFDNAEEASHTMYRLVKKDPHDVNDFMRWIDENPQMKKRVKKSKREWCKSHASSFFSTQEKAKEKTMLYPQMKKKYKAIAEGYLSPNDGVISQTGNNPYHFSFWQYDGINIHQNFRVIHNF